MILLLNVLVSVSVAAALAFIAYDMGYDSGFEAAPETIAYRSERDKELDEYLSDFDDASSSRQYVCDRIFDLISAELSDEDLLLQEELSQVPDRR